MKTNYVPAIVMLLAGGVYCLFGIFYQVPLMDFLVRLLIILIIFWIIGGIIRMVLDKFIGEIENKSKEDEEVESNEEDSEEGSEDTEEKDAKSEDEE